MCTVRFDLLSLGYFHALCLPRQLLPLRLPSPPAQTAQEASERLFSRWTILRVKRRCRDRDNNKDRDRDKLRRWRVLLSCSFTSRSCTFPRPCPCPSLRCYPRPCSCPWTAAVTTTMRVKEVRQRVRLATMKSSSSCSSRCSFSNSSNCTSSG